MAGLLIGLGLGFVGGAVVGGLAANSGRQNGVGGRRALRMISDDYDYVAKLNHPDNMLYQLLRGLSTATLADSYAIVDADLDTLTAILGRSGERIVALTDLRTLIGNHAAGSDRLRVLFMTAQLTEVIDREQNVSYNLRTERSKLAGEFEF